MDESFRQAFRLRSFVGKVHAEGTPVNAPEQAPRAQRRLKSRFPTSIRMLFVMMTGTELRSVVGAHACCACLCDATSNNRSAEALRITIARPLKKGE
jgi:hypothetical protein